MSSSHPLLEKELGNLIELATKPSTAPFDVIYSFFGSTSLAKLSCIYEKTKNDPPHSYVGKNICELLTEDELKKAESQKQKSIQFWTSLEEKKIDLDQSKRNYEILKTYFKEKTEKLNLKNALIFYDDKALRIDIGYGPRLFAALFREFKEILKKSLYSDVSLYESQNTIISAYMQSYYEVSLKTEQDNWLKKADHEFSKPLPIKKKITSIDQVNEMNLLTQCLQNSQGIVIGENNNHKDSSPKEFLIDNMALLKSQGVSTIYLEHVLQEPLQALLDEYLISSDKTTMPKILELYLELLDMEKNLEFPYSFKGIVQAAKNNGIRIIGIDTEATYKLSLGKTSRDLNDSSISIKRYKGMNMAMLECFKKHDDGKKYIVFVGSGHTTTCEGVPGISDLLGCPNIVICDSKEEKIQYDSEFHYENGKTIKFDILYHRKPTFNETKQTENEKKSSLETTKKTPALFPSNKEISGYNSTGYNPEKYYCEEQKKFLSAVDKQIKDNKQKSFSSNILERVKSIVNATDLAQKIIQKQEDILHNMNNNIQKINIKKEKKSSVNFNLFSANNNQEKQLDYLSEYRSWVNEWDKLLKQHPTDTELQSIEKQSRKIFKNEIKKYIKEAENLLNDQKKLNRTLSQPNGNKT